MRKDVYQKVKDLIQLELDEAINKGGGRVGTQAWGLHSAVWGSIPQPSTINGGGFGNQHRAFHPLTSGSIPDSSTITMNILYLSEECNE